MAAPGEPDHDPVAWAGAESGADVQTPTRWRSRPPRRRRRRARDAADRWTAGGGRRIDDEADHDRVQDRCRRPVVGAGGSTAAAAATPVSSITQPSRRPVRAGDRPGGRVPRGQAEARPSTNMLMPRPKQIWPATQRVNRCAGRSGNSSGTTPRPYRRPVSHPPGIDCTMMLSGMHFGMLLGDPCSACGSTRARPCAIAAGLRWPRSARFGAPTASALRSRSRVWPRELIVALEVPPPPCGCRAYSPLRWCAVSVSPLSTW